MLIMAATATKAVCQNDGGAKPKTARAGGMAKNSAKAAKVRNEIDNNNLLDFT